MAGRLEEGVSVASSSTSPRGLYYASGRAGHGVEALNCFCQEVAVVGRRGDRSVSLVILKSMRLGVFNAATAEGARLRRLLRKG
jgi:hypothetical protein